MSSLHIQYLDSPIEKEWLMDTKSDHGSKENILFLADIISFLFSD